ncbi:MAG: tripartite tricarboxylate transporter substrate-binding protein [Proteobacteria bacterium]|nr:tripartite tricarboxylate transporter substrate-binding protein [Pseudomonadota bacterium]
MAVNPKGLLSVALVALSAIAVASANVYAQDYFKGKTMKIIVAYGAGGTYDQYSRIFARRLAALLPGKPTIIVQNMTGGGGLKAMNWAYNIMSPDGYGLLMPIDNAVVNQLLLPEKVHYDARNFTWIGTSNQTNMVIIIRSDTGVRDWKDLLKRNTVGATAGASGHDYVTMSLARSLLGFNVKLVKGYKGATATTHAVEQGEAEMNCNNWLAYASKVPQWFKGDKPFARAIIQMGVFRDPDLPPTVPLLSELAKDPIDKAAVEFAGVAGLLGRGLVVPPKTPSHVIKALRVAYDKMNDSDDFKAELKKRRLRLMPAKGADIQKIVNKAVNDSSPQVVARARELIYGK